MSSVEKQIPLIVRLHGKSMIYDFSKNVINTYVYIVSLLYIIIYVIFLSLDKNIIYHCDKSHIIGYNSLVLSLFLVSNIYFHILFKNNGNLTCDKISLCITFLIFHIILIGCGIYVIFIVNYNNNNCINLINSNSWVLTHISFYVNIISLLFYIIFFIYILNQNKNTLLINSTQN